MHTPTPWYVAGTPDGYAIRFANPHEHFEIAMVREDIGAYRGTNDDDEGEANAAFIRKACNMHEELLAAVRSLIPLAVHTSPLDVSVAIARNLLAKANE